jgi:hypothetical protein
MFDGFTGLLQCCVVLRASHRTMEEVRRVVEEEVQSALEALEHVPLYNKCSDVCRYIRQRLHVMGMEAKTMYGEWHGPISDAFMQHRSQDPAVPPGKPLGHNWLEVRICDDEVVVIDPTYIQFTGETWSFEGSLLAIQYCKMSTGMDRMEKSMDEILAQRRAQEAQFRATIPRAP